MTERSPLDERYLETLRETVERLAVGQASTLDLKIASAALTEMADAYEMFAPYRDTRKVTIFGSARTTPEDPLFALTVDVAHRLSAHGWMVVTGAGPGIMEAGMVGAGRENSIGVSIRLPFETSANSIIAGDEKYVSMRYFFTRKLMLMKESHAFLCLPGGFGTLDEMFELLTRTQTGKGVPSPIVLLDRADDPFWSGVHDFIASEVLPRGLVSEQDLSLFTVTNEVERAVNEIVSFYRNYHSIRFVRGRLLVRLHRAPNPHQLAYMNEHFGLLCEKGQIEIAEATQDEIDDKDCLDLLRIRLAFNGRNFGKLRQLIDYLNTF